MEKPAPAKPELPPPRAITYKKGTFTSITIWIDSGMNWYGNRSGKRGRSQTFSMEAIEFCLTIACLLNAPLRRAIEITRSVLKAALLNWPVPNYSTLSRRSKEMPLLT